MSSKQSYERLEERIVSVDSFNPVVEDKPYESGKFWKFPIIPNPVKDQVIILYNDTTGAILVADDRNIPLPKEIRQKKPNRQILISLQSKRVSVDMNIRANNYASFFRISVSADVRITNGVQLFEQYKSNLGGIGVDIGNAIANECYEEIRKIGRKFPPQDYVALEEELDARVPGYIRDHSYDLFASLEIINMRFHVNLTSEHEDILHEATYANYQNSAQRAILMSEAENMHVMAQVMGSGADADVWLEVAQGRMTPMEAIERINSRSQGKRDKEIDVIEKLIKQGVLTDKEIQSYMKNVLDNAVDSSAPGRSPATMLGSGEKSAEALPDAADIPDLDEEE